jgi:hypothetical protein
MFDRVMTSEDAGDVVFPSAKTLYTPLVSLALWDSLDGTY